jgi:DNA-binding transcriptional ArsR family regulator
MTVRCSNSAAFRNERPTRACEVLPPAVVSPFSRPAHLHVTIRTIKIFFQDLDHTKLFLYKNKLVQELLFIDESAVAAALLQPSRLDLVKRLGEPRTCPDLAEALGMSTQQVNYHVKKLVEAGLVDRVDERRVRGTVEGIYQARAASYWLSANLVGRLGKRRAEKEVGLSYLLSLAVDLQEDVARLAGGPAPADCLGVSLEVSLSDPGRREEFLEDVQDLLKGLAGKYGGGKRGGFKLMLACYEKPKGSGKHE